MNDEELEATLRRYRGINPPAALRARVAARRGPVRVPLTRLDWALAAAALLLTAGAAMTDPDLSKAANEVQTAWEISVEQLAATMGGGEGALAYARMVVPRPVLTPQAEEE